MACLIAGRLSLFLVVLSFNDRISLESVINRVTNNQSFTKLLYGLMGNISHSFSLFTALIDVLTGYIHLEY